MIFVLMLFHFLELFVPQVVIVFPVLSTPSWSSLHSWSIHKKHNHFVNMVNHHEVQLHRHSVIFSDLYLCRATLLAVHVSSQSKVLQICWFILCFFWKGHHLLRSGSLQIHNDRRTYVK